MLNNFITTALCKLDTVVIIWINELKLPNRENVFSFFKKQGFYFFLCVVLPLAIGIKELTDNNIACIAVFSFN